MPCWHTGVHPSMPTFVHQLRCSTRRVIRTTVPQRIRHKDPQAAADRDHLNNANQSAAYHDCHCKPKSPLYAGQTVSVLNDAKILWLPATVIHQAKHGSYLVQVIGGGQYRCAHDHIRERHPDAVKPDVLTSTDVAPATPESSPGLFPVRPVTAALATAPVAPATPKPSAAPAATRPMDTPRKPPTAVVLAESIHWKCHKDDQHSTCCHSPINQSQEASNPAS